MTRIIIAIILLVLVMLWLVHDMYKVRGSPVVVEQIIDMRKMT